MRVKICGLTRLEDVNTALDEGADAVGFVVESPSSPRNLTIPRARRLIEVARIFSTTVAVTCTREPKRLLRICTELRPSALQLHYYTPRLIQFIRKQDASTKLILATPIRDGLSLRSAKNYSHYSDAILTDTPSETGIGGTGQTNDWQLAAKVRDSISPHPLIMAGGLTPKNVEAAIRKVRPFAVDVSSGVERTPGIKDHRKIREFIMHAKEAAN